MVHTVFDTATIGYDDFIQSGGGIDGLQIGENNYFKGAPPYQRGYGLQKGAGIGDVFRGLWRFFLPLIRRVGSTVSEEALNTGHRVFDKVVNEGQPLKDTIANEGRKGIDTVLEKGGFQKQFGSGTAIKRKSRRKEIIPNHQTIIGKVIKKPVIQSKKRLRSDAFGLY
jgi:hypothetical protein